MRSRGLVLKSQGETRSKPVHKVYFLNSWVIGSELMSGALGAWSLNHKVDQLTMHNFLYSQVIGWELMSCALGPGVETTK